jgi:hypothetical protein
MFAFGVLRGQCFAMASWIRSPFSVHSRNGIGIRNNETDKAEVQIFGFSFGALIALIVSAYVNPTKLYLCSLSPFLGL